MLCDLITCYSIESAWRERLTLKHDKLVSNFAFNLNLRRYTTGWKFFGNLMDAGRLSICGEVRRCSFTR